MDSKTGKIENEKQKQTQEQKQEQTQKQKQKMPATLFQLLIYLIKKIIRTLPKRILFAVITGIVVLAAHTYLMVVKNEGFRLDNGSSLLKYILMLDGGGHDGGMKALNVTLFWMLLSAVFWGTIAQIRGMGIKVFFVRQVNNWANLFSDIFEKPGTIQLSIFLASICIGLLSGILLASPYVTILISISIFLAVSARGSSLLILVLYLGWSDYQRLFGFNPRKPFYTDIVSMALRGVSSGLFVISFAPFIQNGKVIQYIILLAFAGLLILNITKKRNPKIASFLFFLGGSFFLFAAKAFADDGGWQEAGGTLGTWSKSDGAKEAVNRGVHPALTAASIGLGFVPVVGDIKDGQEVLTGIDLVTGEELAWWERGVTLGATFVPFVSGKLLRTGIKGGLEIIGFAAKHGDNIADIVKHGDDVADIVKHGDNVADVTKAGEKFVDVKKMTPEILATKPKHAPDPTKWEGKGGTISVDGKGNWTYHDNAGNAVSYPNGYPDFKSAGMVKQEVNIGKFEGYSKDFAKADELAPNGPKSLDSTWHHKEDLTTMQEINRDLHRKFTHKGGMSTSKKK